MPQLGLRLTRGTPHTYTEDHAWAATQQLRPLGPGLDLEIAPNVTLKRSRPGHILGAASVQLRLGDGGPNVGFSGDLGRQLIDGAQELKMLGRYVRVRADIVDLQGFSVHADADELLDWVRRSPTVPDTVFVVHGEPASSAALADAIRRDRDWTSVVPRLNEAVRLDAPSEVAGSVGETATLLAASAR